MLQLVDICQSSCFFIPCFLGALPIVASCDLDLFDGYLCRVSIGTCSTNVDLRVACCIVFDDLDELVLYAHIRKLQL
jgi:hypothetical protein